MSRFRTALFRLVLGASLGLPLAAVSSAQEGGRLEAESVKPGDDARFNKLRTAEQSLTDSDKALLEKKAKYLVYRLTWPENQEKSVLREYSSVGRELSQIYSEFERSLADIKSKQAKEPTVAEKRRKFQEEYNKQLVPAIDKVLKQGNPIARVNAARMLAKLAETGDEELGDALAAVLEDGNQLDAVRYWAAVGMKHLFENVEKIRKEEREVRCVQALVNALHRSPNLPADADLPEKGAFFYVRRAYVAALGAFPKPALVDNRKVVAQPALELLKVISSEGLSVGSVSSERVEAALGLCQMKPKHYDNYQPDYAAYYIGQMLMDFFARYNIERQNPELIKREPWRIQAARLKEGLKAMADDTKNPYVNALQSRADGLFDQAMANQAVVPKPFADWLSANPPKSPSLYKDDPKSVTTMPKSEGQ